MHIDEKFKDAAPSATLARIESILQELGFDLKEAWNDTGIEDCFGLRVSHKGKFPGTNGKGITAELARCSAYGEFMERLQSGLFFYKYQSLEDIPELFLHTYAPDKRYMTADELLEDSEWMEPITQVYGISKEEIAKQCEMYAASKNILTLPYYDLFHDKYVYLPAAFVEHVYSANGCCVGNTREEAWIHALSEIMERHCNIKQLCSDMTLPQFPEEQLMQYPTVKRILTRIRNEGCYEVDIRDCSLGMGFPVVLTTILCKKTHRYIVNVGADPILEIAIERTLTENFQGRQLAEFSSQESEHIIGHANSISRVINIRNQLETGRGTLYADFFLPSDAPCAQFPDYSHLSNKELVHIVLDIFRNKGLTVYVRNNAFLGFPCYKFVIPGFSESRGLRLQENPQPYAIGQLAAPALRNLRKASDIAMYDVLLLYKLDQGVKSRKYYLPYLCGLPLELHSNTIGAVHYAYAAYRIKNYTEALLHMNAAAGYWMEEEMRSYVKCIHRYLSLLKEGVPSEKAQRIIARLYETKDAERLAQSLATFGDPFSDLLLSCCMPNCEQCRHREQCHFVLAKEVIANAGKHYARFTDGQARENFAI